MKNYGRSVKDTELVPSAADWLAHGQSAWQCKALLGFPSDPNGIPELSFVDVLHGMHAEQLKKKRVITGVAAKFVLQPLVIKR